MFYTKKKEAELKEKIKQEIILEMTALIDEKIEALKNELEKETVSYKIKDGTQKIAESIKAAKTSTINKVKEKINNI